MNAAHTNSTIRTYALMAALMIGGFLASAVLLCEPSTACPMNAPTSSVLRADAAVDSIGVEVDARGLELFSSIS